MPYVLRMIFIPVLIVAGCGLLWVAIDIADSIFGAVTFESVRMTIRALLAAVTGAGLIFIAYALSVRGSKEKP